MTPKQIASILLAITGSMVGAYLALIATDVFMAWWTFRKMSTMLILHGVNPDVASIWGIVFMLVTMLITNGVMMALIRRKKTIWAPSIGMVLIIWFSASYLVGAQYSGSTFDIMSAQPRMKYYRTDDNLIHNLPIGAKSGPEGQPAYLFDSKTAQEYAKQQSAAKKAAEKVTESPRRDAAKDSVAAPAKPEEKKLPSLPSLPPLPPTRPLITFSEDEPFNHVEGWVEQLTFSPKETILFMAARGKNHQKATIAFDEDAYLVDEQGRILTSPHGAMLFQIHQGFGKEYYGYDIRADEVFHFWLLFEGIPLNSKELFLYYKWFGDKPIALGPMLPFAKRIAAETPPPAMPEPTPKPSPLPAQSPATAAAGPVSSDTPTSPEADHPILVNPVQTFDVRPVYPKSAEAANVDGTVIVEAEIDTDGNVVNPRIVQSIPLLDQAAIDAVSQWKYRPGLRNGIPVSVKVTVRVKFTQPPTVQNTFPGLDTCSILHCF